jgi:FG-GAP repeat
MNKILLVGFMCLSLGAFAQSSADQGQASNAKTAAAPKDAASGQTAGKRMHQPVTIHSDAAAQDQATGKATGKKMASDDWSAKAAAKSTDSKNGQAGARVAAGDVNGDGRADLTATKNSGHATEKNAVMNSSSSVQSPRDAASGQASGKRQHQPVTTTKPSDDGTKK